MKVRRVAPENLPALTGQSWVEKNRRPYVDGGVAFVPVRNGFDSDLDLPERRPYTGRGFAMIGSIAVLQGDEPTAEEVRQIEAWTHPTGILWVRSREGIMRIPDARVLSGESSVVCHRESGIRYWLDPSKVMFSPGNRQEKARLAGLITKGEQVADMFAGIGYFSLPAALAGARVHAMELNPVAFEYLCRNLKENGVQDRVHAECGDCRGLLTGWYDRILMGHFDARSMLDQALGHIRPGGTIHLHETGCKAPSLEPAYHDCLSIESVRRVKKVGPHTWHYVLDLRAT
jgi:tRNA wybutosine-synthesizing protein 2